MILYGLIVQKPDKRLASQIIIFFYLKKMFLVKLPQSCDTKLTGFVCTAYAIFNTKLLNRFVCINVSK